MTEDPPADVLATLVQLLEESGAALAEGDAETAREAIDTVESVTTNKLPEGELRQHLLHGCGRVRILLDPDRDDGVEPEPAAEYVAAMERRLPDQD